MSNRLTLHNLPRSLADELKTRLTFVNPAWLENDKMGRWQGRTPRVLSSCESRPDGSVVIPRGFLTQLVSLYNRDGIAYQIRDKRHVLPEVEFEFKGKLRHFQEEAVEALLRRDFGTLSAPTGAGKTVIALAVIVKRKRPVLIIVHTKELLAQWIDRIETFLEIPRHEVGVIGQGKRTIGKKITVALVQSLYKCAAEIAPQIGFLVVDECHRTPSRTFTNAVSAFDCRYMLGLSATPWRRDGLSRLIFWYIGDMVHEIKKADLIQTGDVLPAEIIVRETIFRSSFDPSKQYTKMLSELTQDPERNALIAQDVAREAKNDSGTCLVLSDRKSHCQALRDILKQSGVSSELLTGDLPGHERQRVVNDLNQGRVRVLVATGQLLGEGFDAAQLSTLFLTTPIRFSGRLLQYLGRVLRPALGKDRARIYDYFDQYVGPLRASFKVRQRVYHAAV